MKKYLSITSLLVLFSFVFLGFKASAQSTSCFSNQIYYLQYGSRDSSTKGEVTKLQNFLIQKGFLGANPSGYFGPTTKQAVIAYQKSKGLTAQGFVGNMTRNVMNGDGCDVNSVNTNQNIPTARKIEPVIGAENTLSNNSSFDLYGTNLSMVSKILFKGDGFEIYSDVLSISNHDYYLTTNIIFNSISNMKSGTNKVNVILIGKDGKQYSTSLYIEIFNNSTSNINNNSYSQVNKATITPSATNINSGDNLKFSFTWPSDTSAATIRIGCDPLPFGTENSNICGKSFNVFTNSNDKSIVFNNIKYSGVTGLGYNNGYLFATLDLTVLGGRDTVISNKVIINNPLLVNTPTITSISVNMSPENSWYYSNTNNYFPVYVSGTNLSKVDNVRIQGNNVDAKFSFTAMSNLTGYFRPSSLINPGNYTLSPMIGSSTYSSVPIKVYPAFSSDNSSLATWSSLILPVGSTFINLKYPSINGMDLKPTISIIDSSKLDSNGCLPGINGRGDISSGTKYTYNGITFCQSYSSDAGMGTVYSSYSNVFLVNGQYYNLYFQLSASNGCNSMDDKNACYNQNNAVASLLKLVNQSLGTAYIKG